MLRNVLEAGSYLLAASGNAKELESDILICVHSVRAIESATVHDAHCHP
jgi:hypothetical protein